MYSAVSDSRDQQPATSSVPRAAIRVVIVTGSGGLVGSTACRFYADRADLVVGIDNDMRATFFGKDASTRWATDALTAGCPNYRHVTADIRDSASIDAVFREYETDIDLVVHSAAQPSHDWAAKEPLTDFAVNATGTLHLLEASRRFSPGTVFIFTSTNKVYGDRPNSLPLVELDSRWEVDSCHPYFEHGIDESMSIDATKHSLFGASKVSADILVQEYARYFEMRTVVLRAGCLTGPAHSGTEMHGFLHYLMKCTTLGTPYQVYGYKAKQVRDNLHSNDLICAFDEILRAPRAGAVYNMGGGRLSTCSMLEAIALSEQIAGATLQWSYQDTARSGDHMWWISDTTKFQTDYPQWRPKYAVADMLREIHSVGIERWHG